MGRSRTITDEQILEAAREVFLAEGFGASTVEIARRAGISEGSIFKRFATKEKLFFAAMGEPEIPAWMRTSKTLAGQGDLKENLVMLSLQIIEFLRQVVPRVVMMQSKGRFPANLEELGDPPLIRDLNALTLFFEAECSLGRIRDCNPEILARVLLGALSNQVLMERMRNGSSSEAATTTYIKELVDLLWQGIAPCPEA